MAYVVLGLLIAALFLTLWTHAPPRDRAKRWEGHSPMSLSECVRRGVVPLTLDNLRRASTRPGFPAPLLIGEHRTGFYAPADVAEWYASRPGSPAVLRAGQRRAAELAEAHRRPGLRPLRGRGRVTVTWSGRPIDEDD